MISMIIPVKNLKDITQSCLDTLRFYTEDYELILINDGSDEETSIFLDGIENSKLIVHETSKGWCKSINEGLRNANGDFIVLSNNDVTFMPNWANKMLAHFEGNPQLGVLGPTSNQVDNRQHMSLNRDDQKLELTDSLIFFCVMIKREVFERIGNLDERFDPGGQEDADFCIRAKQAGYDVGIARDVFLYHYGSATFRKEFNYDAPRSKEFADSRKKLLVEKYSSRFYKFREGKGYYTPEYYRLNYEGNGGGRIKRSAKEIVPWILKLVQPKSIVDVGCSLGGWLSIFKKHKIEDVLGIDGDWIDKKMLQIPEEQFLSVDLEEPFLLDRQFDLVMSLETAEHLAEDCAEAFVDSLTELGSVILFSSAVPGQGGVRHINEQWPDYWIKLFQDKGYVVIDCLREKIRGNEKVMWWYAQNILMFVKQNCLEDYPLLEKEYQHTDPSKITLTHPGKRKFEEASKVLDYSTKKKVFIAIPTVRSSIVPGLVYNLIRWCSDPRYIVRLYIRENLYPLDNARNTIIKEFLELEYDYLWWIDDDIVPLPDTMHKLIQADKDIIGATCFSMKSDNGEYFPYPVTLRYNEDKKYEVYYGQGIEEVDTIGGACVMVKRRVYEVIERPYEYIFHRDGTLGLTADFRFCQQAQERGFKIFVDYNLLCDHQRLCSIKGFQDTLSRVGGK